MEYLIKSFGWWKFLCVVQATTEGICNTTSLTFCFFVDNPASVKYRLSAEVKTTASLIIDNPASVKYRLSAEVKTTASLIIGYKLFSLLKIILSLRNEEQQ
jgi:hypothetical protein